MKYSRNAHFVLKTGTLSLAALVGLGAVDASAQSAPSLQPVSSANPSSGSTSFPAGPSSSSVLSEDVQSTLAAVVTQGEELSEAISSDVTSSPEPSFPGSHQSATEGATPSEPVESIAGTHSATPELSPSSTAEVAQETPASEPSADDDFPNDVPVALDVQAPAFVRPGETLEGVVTNIPEGNHITAELVSESGQKVLSCDVTIVEGASKVTCDVPENYDGGTYLLRIHLLDGNDQPVVVGDKEVVDSSQTVQIADVPADYNPRVVAQYPITAAGYVMPIAGAGYEKNSQITISATDVNGNPIPSATFISTSDSKTPTVEDLRNSSGTLTVSTDENGDFKAYMVLSPYMTSGVVNIVAHDEKNNISTSDSIIVLGESVAEISTSVESIEADKAVEIEIEGDKFAPSYTQYPVAIEAYSKVDTHPTPTN